MPAKKHTANWMRRAGGASGIESYEAYFAGKGYGLHRHDTYAIGQTLSGVQSFHYAGARRDSLPGTTVVLHPDEAHDGQAGTAAGFAYRIAYIEPARIQQVLGGQQLPFIDQGISTDPRLQAATTTMLDSLHASADPLAADDALFDLAHALNVVAGATPQSRRADYRAASVARDFIHTQPQLVVTLDTLEQQSGRDRWALSRDFRTFFGTSPYRYLTMRRLDLARQLLLQGLPLAQVALEAGFTDQSHLTRHFTKTYGMSPSLWLRMQRPPG